MRNRTVLVLVLGLGASLAACSSADDMSGAIGLKRTGEADGTQVAAFKAQVEAAKPRVIEVEKDGLSFSYAWPARAAEIEELNALMEEKSAAALAEYEGYVAEARADAAKYDYPFRRFLFGMGWEVSGKTEGLLSLVGAQSTYTGGAHGNRFYDALVWNKSAGKGMATREVFVSASALEQAVREPYCAKLQTMRAARIGKEMVEGIDVFDSCPPISDLAVVLVSDEATAFNRIDLVAAPYVAGSYVEGEYVVELPVTQAVIKAAKPDYRDAFALPAG